MRQIELKIDSTVAANPLVSAGEEALSAICFPAFNHQDLAVAVRQYTGSVNQP